MTVSLDDYNCILHKKPIANVKYPNLVLMESVKVPVGFLQDTAIWSQEDFDMRVQLDRILLKVFPPDEEQGPSMEEIYSEQELDSYVTQLLSQAPGPENRLLRVESILARHNLPNLPVWNRRESRYVTARLSAKERRRRQIHAEQFRRDHRERARKEAGKAG